MHGNDGRKASRQTIRDGFHRRAIQRERRGALRRNAPDLERGEALPFRLGTGTDGKRDGWILNESNPYVAAFQNEAAADDGEIGEIGNLFGSASDFFAIWAIVGEAKIPLSDIEENWTFDRMQSFMAVRQMRQDYRSAWRKFYEMKSEANHG